MQNPLKIKLLDRYLVSEIIEPLIFSIVSFTLILAGAGILFTLVKEAIRYGYPMSLAFKFFLLRLPAVMVYTFPMSMLLATILTCGRLSADCEITAFKAAGINAVRLALPVILVGFLVSILSLVFNESLVPKANQLATQLFLQATSQESPKIKENVNLPQYEKGQLARVLTARKLEGNALKEVSILEFEKGGLARIISAHTAVWRPGEGWLFEDGRIFQIAPDGESLFVIKFKEELLNMPATPKELSEEEISPEEMNWFQLKKYIAQRTKRGEETTFHKVQMNFKLSIPFASLLFAVIGFPLGYKQPRGGKSVGFGLSLLVIFAYYLLFSISMGLGLKEIIPPGASAWLPNIIIGGMGIYLLKKVAD